MSGTEKSGHSARGREDEKMKKMSERQGEMRAGAGQEAAGSKAFAWRRETSASSDAP